MSHQLFSRNADLKKLRDEGYFVKAIDGYLVVGEVPYVDIEGRIKRGSFASALKMNGDNTVAPSDHTVMFVGDRPYNVDGSEIPIHSAVNVAISDSLTAKFKYSRKPKSGYKDYHHLVTTYAGIFSSPAQAIDPELTPRIYRSPDPDEECVFNYFDTASSRAGINNLSNLLRSEKVAIVGLGGTGSYVLDFVSKTPVAEIRIFDADGFETHSAFRAPGAASIDELRDAPSKVCYHHAKFSRLHRNIVVHEAMLHESNLTLLDGVSFVFICIDASEAKSCLINYLEKNSLPFIDCGMGLQVTDGKLGGILRTTASTENYRQHVHEGSISFAGGGDDPYTSNIQIAELNALNAAHAVVKWKKIRGFYHDAIHEMQSLYMTDGNDIVNDQTTSSEAASDEG